MLIATHTPEPGLDVLDDVRAACRAVTECARHVRIDDDRLAATAEALATELRPPLAAEVAESAGDSDGHGNEHGSDPADARDRLTVDPWSLPARVEGATRIDDEQRAALVLTMAAVNFGSGWHPVLRKQPGCSGATSMAVCLRRWAAVKPVTAARLLGVTATSTHVVFGQPRSPDVDGLMNHFVIALRDLGRTVAREHDGSFLDFVACADGTAAGLVRRLHALPYFRDVARYDELVVPFYKRAQLAAADLERAFAGRSPAGFGDLDRLTAFADNLVPHVLRVDGVLRYDEQLAERIEAGRLLLPGSAEEVEIRAAGVDAVERLRDALAAHGITVRSSDLDAHLWRRGGGARYKAVPRHRARSVFY